LRQQIAPGGLKRRACLFVGSGRAIPLLPRLCSWKEAASPFPLIDIDRHAAALGDRADLDIAKEDAPALTMRVVIAAAGEGGHAP
jgi:hypothetical protein